MPKLSKQVKGFSPSRYLRETRAELRKVTWPTRDEAVKLTIVVLVTILVMAILLGVLDLIFAKVLDLII
ncbi:MAG: preprotein translocase subunit SecE [Chloroflexi bacterium]|nr:MAG: preprotein translocase subunit SecE [Chloroflexota bacterium]